MISTFQSFDSALAAVLAKAEKQMAEQPKKLQPAPRAKVLERAR